MAARRAAETVEEVRKVDSPTPAETPRTTSRTQESDQPATQSGALVPKQQRNMQSTMAFAAELLAAGAKDPTLTLETVLEDLGYVRDYGEDGDDSFGQDSSNFSFNMENSSSVASASGLFSRDLRRSTNALARFTTPLAHRCFAGASAEKGGARRNRSKNSGHDEDEASTVVPWIGDASIMFIDLSGYSTIATHLTNNGGAHALSTAVNAYFEAILSVVVDQHAGEVLTFAGDAIVACWPVVGPRTARISALTACACAMDLQRRCGISRVPGTDLAFRMHIGITHGEIRSTVLASRVATSMQAAYHFVSGAPMTETAVVDSAKIGEVCITEDVSAAVNSNILELAPVSPTPTAAAAASEKEVTPTTTPLLSRKRMFLLTHVDDEYQEILAEAPAVPSVERSDWLEKNAVPPTVAKKLRQGFKAAHVAELRVLAVLFIKKTSHRVDVAEWFTEVQAILDAHRCPVVQILEDDKGTHIVAAVNLYQMERDPTGVAIAAASALVARETACAVGIALGEVFCGITGSDVAGRWDITGPAVVRACRLMQHAESTKTHVVIDETLREAAIDVSQLVALPDKLTLKGAGAPVTAYSLAPSSVSITASISSGVRFDLQTSVHKAARERFVSEFLKTDLQRGAAVIQGPIGVGKRRMVAAAIDAICGMTHFVHHCARGQKPLALLDTLASWYRFHSSEGIAASAKKLSAAVSGGKLTRSLELGHDLVDSIIEAGERVCVVVAYAHHLDSASLGFVKSTIGARPTPGDGSFLVAFTLHRLWNATSPEDLAAELNRGMAGNARYNSPKAPTSTLSLSLSYLSSPEELGEALFASTGLRARPKTLEIMLEATGGCLALLPSLLDMMRDGFGTKEKFFATTADGTIHITGRGEDYLMTEVYWPHVAPSVTARFVEVYDTLPPRLQLLLRVVASMSTTTGSAGLEGVCPLMQRFNAKLSEEGTRADAAQLKKMGILKQYGREEEDEVACTVPAMMDVLTSLLTPDQDRMLKRYTYNLVADFFDSGKWEEFISDDHKPIFVSFVGRIARAAGQVDKYKECLRRSWDYAVKPAAAANVEKMQLRLLTEHRRFPEHITPALFEGIEPAPLLRKFQTPEEAELQRLDLLPTAISALLEYEAPLALGEVGYELWALAMQIAGQYFRFTKHAEFSVATTEKLDTAGLRARLPVLDRFAPGSADAIVNALDKLVESPDSVEGALANAAVFSTDLANEVKTRSAALVAFASEAVDALALGMTCKVTGVCGAGRGLKRLLRPLSSLDDVTLHEALMDFATMGLTSACHKLSLEGVRDRVLRMRTASAAEFKAMLLLKLM